MCYHKSQESFFNVLYNLKICQKLDHKKAEKPGRPHCLTGKKINKVYIKCNSDRWIWKIVELCIRVILRKLLCLNIFFQLLQKPIYKNFGLWIVNYILFHIYCTHHCIILAVNCRRRRKTTKDGVLNPTFGSKILAAILNRENKLYCQEVHLYLGKQA